MKRNRWPPVFMLLAVVGLPLATGAPAVQAAVRPPAVTLLRRGSSTGETTGNSNPRYMEEVIR